MYPNIYYKKSKNYPYYLGNKIINFKEIIIVTNKLR